MKHHYNQYFCSSSSSSQTSDTEDHEPRTIPTTADKTDIFKSTSADVTDYELFLCALQYSDEERKAIEVGQNKNKNWHTIC